jgi:hypothetical protein
VTELGDRQNYFLSIQSPFGSASPGWVIDSAQAAPGTHFFYACTLAGRMDSLSIAPDSGAPLDRYRLDVSYQAGHQALYSVDCYNSNGSNQYALTSSPGQVDFFMAGGLEFQRYLAGLPFQAMAADENCPAANHSVNLPRTENWYAVVSNEERSNMTVFVDVVTRLYKRGVGLAEAPPQYAPEKWASVSANPFRSRLTIRLSSNRPADATVRILDRAGRLVKTIAVPPGARAVDWGGADDAGRAVPAGVYFCCSGGEGKTCTEPAVFLGNSR